MIKKLRDDFNLKWLRVSISYHRFSNLGQGFQGDLSGKLTKNVQSEDFAQLKCNCNKKSLVNGECAYGGECRASIVVYKAECKECKMCYLGNTQQKIKLRINQHLGEVCKLVNTGKTSDSFARHFAQHHNVQRTKIDKCRTRVEEQKNQTYHRRGAQQSEGEYPLAGKCNILQ